LPNEARDRKVSPDRTRRAEASARKTRPTWIALSLGTVLGLQLWMCWGKLGLPFLDTRLHYNYDNADFLFRARSGNRNGDLRSQFGVTVNAYSRWGDRVGRPSYNTDHPFLVKALFQQYTRIAGLDESASRDFYLGVSFLAAAGLYVLVLVTTDSLLASLAAAAIFVTLPVCAVYQTCVKFEMDGMLVSVWLFVALALYLKTERTGPLLAYGILTVLAFLTHWTAILFVGTVTAWLATLTWRRKEIVPRRALEVTISSSLVGAAGLLALMSYLQGGWRNLFHVLTGAFTIRAEPIPMATWWSRQWLYAKINFTDEFVWLILGSAVVIGVAHWSRRKVRESSQAPRIGASSLEAFATATAIVAILWIVTFRQGSYIHVYWQYWLAFPIAVLTAQAIRVIAKSSLRSGGAASLTVILVLLLTVVSRKTYAGVLTDQLGMRDDIAFLSSLREDRFTRFVFVPITDAKENAWFQGQLFEYYTDRPVVVLDSGQRLRPGDKVLVLRFVQRETVVTGLERWSGTRLANEKCGPRFCAYDVVGTP
jgi:hypothetical protein